MSTLLRAYTGKEPYIFVSYSHKDRKFVYTEIQRLIEVGYRIWYDEGIETGERWPKAIATKVSPKDQ